MMHRKCKFLRIFYLVLITESAGLFPGISFRPITLGSVKTYQMRILPIK